MEGVVTKVVKLEIPAKLVEGLNNGELVRAGGIIQNANNGKIVKWLKTYDIEDTTCWQDLGNSISRVVKENKKGVVAISVIISTAIVAGIVYKGKKNKSAKEEMKYNLWLNKSIRNYLKLAREGKLDLNAIMLCEKALDSLPIMTEKLYINDNLIELKGNLKTFTEQLAATHDYELIEPERLSASDNFIENMLANLKVQRKILEKTM